MEIYLVSVILTLSLLVSVRGDGEEDGADGIVIDALGRTFTLGMLYDRRSDRIIPGKTLWNPDQLQRNLSTRSIRSSEYTVKMRDSLEDKADLMKIEAGIKVSFLGGLVSVGGSARYLDDKRTSKYDARVTMKYDARTRFEQLTMVHLNRSNIRYPGVLNDGEATHVVVGIEYGIQAYFIFEKTVSDLSHEKEVYGELKSVLNIISLVPVDPYGRVEMNEELTSKVNDLNVKFYGDIVLPQNPTTFEEAVKIYKELPNYVIGQNAHSVPMKVYLAPLEKLDPSGVFDMIRDISESLITDVVTIMQELEDAKEEAQDLSRAMAARYFSFTSRKNELFLNLLRQYKQEFKSHIGPLLVQIRGSAREERELALYLQQHFNSLFNKASLTRWLNQVSLENSVLQSFVQRLRNVTFCKNVGECFMHTMWSEKVISLNLYFPQNLDPILEQMDNYLEGRNSTTLVNSRLWFHHWQTTVNFRTSINEFLDYKEVNKADSSIKFICAILPPRDPARQRPYAEIRGMQSEGAEDTFIPPGPSSGIREQSNNNTVLLQWEPPSQSSAFVHHYQIVVTQRGMAHFEESIEYRYQTISNETEFQIMTPDSFVPYDVYIYGVCRVGRTPSSEVLHHSGVEVRLVGGAEICSPRRAHSGRLEVLRNYIWGTVCGRWTDKEAGVACRMMGFSGGIARAVTSDLQGSGQIWMMNVVCDGSEENLDLCSFDWAPEGACNHSMDAVVECYGGAPTSDASTPEQCSIDTLQELLTLARSNMNMARQELNNERDARLRQMTELDKERDARRRDMTALQSKVTSLQTDTNTLERKLSDYFSVAFHATISQQRPVIRLRENAVFNTVGLNTGNGYNRYTGVFTVPDGSAGLYFFSVHFVTYDKKHVWMRIYQNDQILCGVHEDQVSSHSENGAGSCSVTVQLNSGDRVYVQRGDATDNISLYCWSKMCGFTGFLMKPD